MPIGYKIIDSAESYARSRYDFFDASVILFPQLYSNIYQYDQTSCNIIARLCLSGMKTTDTLLTQSDMQHVSVLRLLGSLWQMFWGGWVSFSQVAPDTIGTQPITITSASLTLLDQFTGWDEALQPNPFVNIAYSFHDVIKDVSP